VSRLRIWAHCLSFTITEEKITGKDLAVWRKSCIFAADNKENVMAMNRYIRFDWAAKYMLRNKADFAIFEGLISV